MEHKTIIIIDNSGNITQSLKTNDSSLQLPEDKIAIDISYLSDAELIMVQSNKYKAILNQDGTYNIVLK